jgi:hypothetical protein
MRTLVTTVDNDDNKFTLSSGHHRLSNLHQKDRLCPTQWKDKIRMQRPEEQIRLKNLGKSLSDPSNPKSINNPNHPAYRLGGIRAFDPNNPRSINNPGHPAFGKGARIANTNRRTQAPRYNFVHEDGRTEQNISCLDMSEKHNLSAVHYLRQVGRKELKSYRGWRLCE